MQPAIAALLQAKPSFKLAQIIDPGPSAGFGSGTSFSDDGFVFAGADGNDSFGKVYVYERNASGQLELLQTIDGQDAGGYIGYNCLDMDAYGLTLIFGSEAANTLGGTGSIYVYKRAARGEQFTEFQRIEFADSIFFGFSIDISDDSRTIAGSDGIIGQTQRGVTRIVVLNAAGTAYELQATLQPADIANGDLFGGVQDLALSPDGNLFFASSLHAVVGGVTAGAGYFFSRTGAVWSEIQKITTSGSHANNGNFGLFCHMSADKKVLAAVQSSPQYVFIFRDRGDGVFEEHQKFAKPSTYLQLNRDGSLLAVPADSLFVAGDDTCVIYKTRGNELFTPVETLSPTGSKAFYGVVTYMTPNGRFLAVGDMGADPHGKVHIYERL